jgi:hypothetical protein
LNSNIRDIKLRRKYSNQNNRKNRNDENSKRKPTKVGLKTKEQILKTRKISERKKSFNKK